MLRFSKVKKKRNLNLNGDKMTNQNQRPKDLWDKLDVIVKGMAAILVSGAITFYGIWGEQKQAEIAEDNRRAQIVVQTLSNRESATSDLKAKMFATLIAHYLKEDKAENDSKTQLAILELIGLNFQDNLHFKPLFEMIDIKYKEKESGTCKRLRKISQNIARKEIEKIVGSGGSKCEINLKVGDSKKLLELKDSKCEIPLEIFLLDVKEDHIKVATDENDKKGFEVNYFDMPLVDNSTKGEITYSIILSETNVEPETAKVNLVILPPAYYGTRNTLKTDQLIADFAEDIYSE
jgi:hypothetical protein